MSPNWHEVQSKLSLDTEPNRPLDANCCTREDGAWPRRECQTAREGKEETAADHCSLHHRCKYCFDYVFEGTTEIVLRRSTHSWKPRRHRRLHVPPCAVQSCCSADHAPHALPRAAALFHAPPRASTVSLTSLLMSALVVPLLTSLACVIRWRHLLTLDIWPLTFQVDRWLWPLTFLQVWLFLSRCSLPSFSRRFHFCSLFLHI